MLLPLALLAAGCGLFGSDDLAVGSCLVRGEADEDGRTSVTVAACDRRGITGGVGAPLSGTLAAPQPYGGGTSDSSAFALEQALTQQLGIALELTAFGLRRQGDDPDTQPASAATK